MPRNLKYPVPETCPLYSGAKNPVTPAWEAYWRDILHLCNPNLGDADFKQAWNSLVVSDRAFTNSPVLKLETLLCIASLAVGATHEMVTGIPERSWRWFYMRIYTLNSRKNPPSIPGPACGYRHDQALLCNIRQQCPASGRQLRRLRFSAV